MPCLKKLLLLPLLALTLHGELYRVDALIEKAIISSPDINVSYSNFAISKQHVTQADADYLPQIDLYGGVGYASVKAFDPSFQSVDTKSSTLVSGKLTASQLIYDFGKTGGNMDYYAQESNASFAIYNQKISDKVNDVKHNYYDLLRKALLIKVYEENVKLTEQQFIRAKRYFTAGIKTKIDVVDAKVRLIEAQIELENAKYDLKLAYVTLDKTIGNVQDSTEGKVYIPEITSSEGLYDDLPKETLNGKELVQYAFTHRQELKSYEHKIKSAQSRIRQESADYYPGIYLGGDYQYNAVQDDALSLYIPEQQWNANINVKWNLFGGMRTVARTEAAKLTLVQEQSTLQDAKLRIVQETSNAYIKLLKTDSNVKLSMELLDAAKDKFDQAQKRYEHGLSDYIELQEARQGYINANADLVVNYYEYYISLAVLDRAIGR